MAFGGIFTGLIIYNWKPTPVSPRRTRKAKEEIAHIANESVVLTEKQRLCDQNGKVGQYSFTKYTNDGLNGMINTQV